MISGLALSCSGSADEGCLVVDPSDTFLIEGNAHTTDFAPDSKAYVVINDCDAAVEIAVDDDVRWLDVEIEAFGDEEGGTLGAGASVEVVIEVRYGADNPTRLDQLAAGAYDAQIIFEDKTNSTAVIRTADVTVSEP